jgi:hypothetical protein
VAATASTLRSLAPRVRLLAAIALLGVFAPDAEAQPRAGTGKGPTPAEPAPLRVTTAVVAGRTVQRSVDTVGSLLAWE